MTFYSEEFMHAGSQPEQHQFS